jgi:hypothetical protein
MKAYTVEISGINPSNNTSKAAMKSLAKEITATFPYTKEISKTAIIHPKQDSLVLTLTDLSKKGSSKLKITGLSRIEALGIKAILSFSPTTSDDKSGSSIISGYKRDPIPNIAVVAGVVAGFLSPRFEDSSDDEDSSDEEDSSDVEELETEGMEQEKTDVVKDKSQRSAILKTALAIKLEQTFVNSAFSCSFTPPTVTKASARNLIFYTTLSSMRNMFTKERSSFIEGQGQNFDSSTIISVIESAIGSVEREFDKKKLKHINALDRVNSNRFCTVDGISYQTCGTFTRSVIPLSSSFVCFSLSNFS